MNIYRHKENKKLYKIEHLVLDIKHLNNNENAGIYAMPYNWDGETISFKSKKHSECKTFVTDNFDLTATY